MANIERIGGPFDLWRLSDGDSSVEVAPGRGALVRSFKSYGDEVLFLDHATFDDPTKNVRGGIPLLFPFAGKPPAGSALPQHGFARTSAFTVSEAIADEATARLECTLVDSPETLKFWPHAFELRFAVSLYDARLLLEWKLTNRGSTPMPIHFGIHPYFHVGDKSQVRVEQANGEAFDNTTQQMRTIERIDFATGETDLHFTPFEAGGTALHRGDGKTVRLSWTPQFTTLVLWTQPGKPFVCVEPWTARGAQPSLLELAPGSTESLAIDISLSRRGEGK